MMNLIILLKKMYRIIKKYYTNTIRLQPNYFHRFIQLLLIAILVFGSVGTASAARIGFNTVYKAVGTSYSSTSSTLTLASPPIPLAGTNFYFTDHTNANLFVAIGGDWHGFFEYYDNAGNLISIAGSIDHQDKIGSTSVALVFTTNTGERYLFIVPGYESLYTTCNAGKLSSSCAISTSSNSPDLNLIAAANPQVYVNVYSLPNFTTCINVASDFQSFSVIGQNLTSNLTVNAPANFEICLTAGGVYSSTVTLIPSGGNLASTNLYVRLKSIATIGAYTGMIVVTGTNIPNQNISVSGQVYPNTSVTVSPSPSTVCASTATTFSITAVGNNLMYQWQVSTNGGGTWANLYNTGIYSGVNSSVLRLSNALSASYSGYQYKSIVTGSCGADTSDPALLTVNSLPSITSNPTNSIVCAGTGTSFSVGATAAGITYQWQVSTDGGSTWTNTTNPVVYTGSASATLLLSNAINSSYDGFQYRCIVSGTCTPPITTSSAILTMNAAPATPGVIAGYTSLCEYTNQSYSIIPVSGATSYSWSLPTDWTGTSGSNVINVVNSTYSGTISVTASNSCGTSAPATLNVTVAAGAAPIPNFTISNAVQCLSGNAFTFTNQSTAAGTTIFSTFWDFGDLANSTNTSPSHSYAVANEYAVLLNVTASNGCVGSVSKLITVNPIPTGLISGSTSICSGNTATISVALTGTAPWTLLLTGSSTPVVVNSSPYIFTVAPSSTTSYTISSLTDANCTASTGDLSGTATVIVNANNPASVSISSDAANNSICFGTSVTFTANATNGGPNPAYQWLRNGVNISGATAATYTTTALADKDKISVILTSNLATCLINSPATSNEIMVAVHPGAPATPATISGTQSQCAGLINQTYSVTNVLNASSYIWSVPAGWTITSGQGTISITVATGSAAQNGDITLTATNGCGTSSPQILAVTVISLDNHITLTSAIGTDSQTTCINSAITDITYATSGAFTNVYISLQGGLPAGVNGAWASNVVTISGTPNVAGTYPYIILLTVGSCTERTAGSITVTAANTVGAASSSPTICINSAIPNITHATTGATGIGIATGLPAGVTPAFASNTITISGTPTEGGTFNYTIPLTGGCGNVNATGTMVVNSVVAAVLIVSSDADNSICAATNITFTANPTNGGSTPTYQWKIGNDNVLGATNSTYTTSSLPDNSTISLVMTSNATCVIGSPATSNIITITVNPLPSLTIEPSGPTTFCNGGTVTLTAATASYYLWNTGATSQSISVTSSGSYSVTVTNANGCSATSTPTLVTVNPLPSPTIEPSGATTVCNGGTATLTAATATNYLWSTGATSQIISVTTSGSYSVTVTNANGCSATSTPTVVTVNPLPTATTEPSGDKTFCDGGSVILTAATATNYLWNTGATSQSITVTSSGSYSVTVTNANGCSAISTPTVVTVNPLPTPIIEPSGATTVCSGGSATLTATTATNYLWSTGATSQIISVTTSGSYSVTVTNANGCSASSAPTVVTLIPLPTPTIEPGGPISFCNGGSATLTAANATNYLWSTGATSQSITVTTAGAYSVTVTNADGCSASSTPTVVTVYPLPSPKITPSGPTTFCKGGLVALTAAPATSYLWNTGATSQSITVTTAGAYSVTVTNADGCSKSNTTIIPVNPLPDIPVVNNMAYCQNDPSSPLQAIPTDSNTIRWYRFPSGGVAIPTPNSNTLLPNVETFYATQTTIFGCESPRVAMTVTIHPIPADSILNPTQNFICDGSFLQLNASNNYTYQWLNNGLPIAGDSSNNYSAHLGGIYSFQMTNQYGCINNSSNSISIQLIKKPAAGFSYDNRCKNTPIQFTNTSNIANSGTIIWNWDFGNGSIGKLKNEQSIYQSIGKYTVTLSARPSNCPLLVDSVKKDLEIEVPIPGIHYGAVNAKATMPYWLSARNFGIAYLWNPFIGLSNPSIQNPTTTLKAEQVYTIRITNNSGCLTQDTVLVRVFNDYGVYVPSGFSPDGDGVNDKLTPILIGIREVRSFRIYNRWGQLLYQTNEKNAGWNGTYKAKPQVSETYVWVLVVITEEGKTILKTGKSTLIR